MKMDYLKRTNKILLSLVIILFVFAIIAFAKVVFNSMSGLEWGSVSDWVSTGSSIATTYIAYLAYKAAPNWFKQKTYEAGFDHVSALMTEYDSIESEIQKLYYNILILNINNPKFLSTCNEVETLMYRVISLLGKLYACERWDVIVLPETHRCFARLRNFCNLCYKLQGYIRTNDTIAINNIREELETLRKIITSDSTDFKKNIHDYFQFPNQKSPL
ncbi:hypothetical protein CIW62_14355 [Enterobacter cloacae]|nr:hypothetical protein CIW62_14355 [Enterobacter cloacae]